ncbi:MAG: ComEC/Rec2 family competence protein [Endomicrobiia bacterium]
MIPCHRRKVISIWFSYLLIIVFLFLNSLLSKELRLYFLYVGQGESTFIVTPNDKTMLIDAADRDEYYDYGEVVYRFIKNLGYKKIDIAMISHPHRDHIGGMVFILSNLKVEKFYDPGFPYPSSTYHEVLEIVKEKNIEYYLARENEKIMLDSELEITILYPPEKLLFDTPNDNSVVLRIKYKNISVLFTGDIEKNAELEIFKKYKKLNQKIVSNILKVPHHGSRTSSTEKFLNLVSPEIGIIFCGKNNRFNFPHREIIKRYKDFGVEIYRTDLNGNIEIIIDGEDYIVNTYY